MKGTLQSTLSCVLSAALALIWAVILLAAQLFLSLAVLALLASPALLLVM